MGPKLRLRWILVGVAALGVAALMAFMLAPRPIEIDTGTVLQGPIAETVADQGVARVREAGERAAAGLPPLPADEEVRRALALQLEGSGPAAAGVGRPR